MILIPLVVNILKGSVIPTPLSYSLMVSLKEMEVKWSAVGDSGFSLTFKFEPGLRADYLDGTEINPDDRMVFNVLLNAVPVCLLDSVVTEVEYNPARQGEAGSLVVRGRGLEDLLDRDEVPTAYPNKSISATVKAVLSEDFSLLAYAISSDVKTPSADSTPDKNKFVNFRNMSKLCYIRYLGDKCGHIFKILPGSVPLTNKAYWGPLDQMSTSTQSTALTVSPPIMRNVEKVSFQYTPMKGFGTTTTVLSTSGTDNTELEGAKFTTESLGEGGYSKTIVRSKKIKHPGMDSSAVKSMAEGKGDLSAMKVLTVKGELNVFTYNDVLTPPGKVKLRGAGERFDGLYHLVEVTHKIGPGSYTQAFTLARKSQGATISSV